MSEHEVFEVPGFLLQKGGFLPQARLAYRTLGTLNKARDNVIVAPTWYTGTHDDTMMFLVGPDHAMNPDRYFIVLPNLLANGLSSSPSNTPAPHDRGRFPKVTFWDNIRLQQMLLTQRLGIEKIRLVSSWSMGAASAYQWAAQYPGHGAGHRADRRVGEDRVLQQGLPRWRSGAPSSSTRPSTTASTPARRSAASRPSPRSMPAGASRSRSSARAPTRCSPPRTTSSSPSIFWEPFFLKCDANDLLSQLWTWMDADISDNPLYKGDFDKALGAIKARTIILPVDNDRYFPPVDSEHEASRIPGAECRTLRVDLGPHGADQPRGREDHRRRAARAARRALRQEFRSDRRMSAAIEDLVIDDTYKGYPNGIAPSRLGDIGKRGWSVLRQEVPLPAAVLLDSALDNNSRWMRRFLELTGARICPHGKTTMSPQLFRRQLADGAWGITVATVDQLRICRAHGIERVLMANQLVERQGIRYVLDELARDPAFDFYCLVDSVEGAQLLAEAARDRGLDRPLQVLLEAGFHGGRTGCRTETQAVATAEAVSAAAPAPGAARRGRLRGADPWRGRRGHAGEDRGLPRLHGAAAAPGPGAALVRRGHVLITAGGSGFFDLAAEGFAPRITGRDVMVVLRSGCYLTHDSRSYERLFGEILARSASAREAGGRLKAALQVWGMVQSTPEPGLALATMGKRDAGFDVDLPVPLLWHREGMNRPASLPEGHVVTAMNDQHAYVQLPPDLPLRFGDLVGFGVSHPCTTFDRWQLIYTVDDAYEITGAIRTFF